MKALYLRFNPSFKHWFKRQFFQNVSKSCVTILSYSNLIPSIVVMVVIIAPKWLQYIACKNLYLWALNLVLFAGISANCKNSIRKELYCRPQYHVFSKSSSFPIEYSKWHIRMFVLNHIPNVRCVHVIPWWPCMYSFNSGIVCHKVHTKILQYLCIFI